MCVSIGSTTLADMVLSPKIPLALRTTSFLLLGLARIFSRQVRYLFNDCNEALVKMKLASQSDENELQPRAVGGANINVQPSRGQGGAAAAADAAQLDDSFGGGLDMEDE